MLLIDVRLHLSLGRTAHCAVSFKGAKASGSTQKPGCTHVNHLQMYFGRLQRKENTVAKEAASAVVLGDWRSGNGSICYKHKTQY